MSTAAAQLESLRNQLCEAYIARQDADEKIKAIRNILAGVQLGQAMAAPPAPVAEDPPQELCK
jgi:hypothetical protein